MRNLGALLAMCGLLAICLSWMADTTKYVYGSGEVSNLGKLQHQMMILHSGIGFLISGCVLFVGGSILDRSGNVAADRQPVSMQRVSDPDEALKVKKLHQIIAGSVLTIFVVLVLYIFFL